MEWAEGNQWSLSVDLAPGVYDFKLVTAVAETGEAMEWEAGDNRQLKAGSYYACICSVQRHVDVQLRKCRLRASSCYA